MKFSIVIPSYNRAHCILDSVRSAVTQVGDFDVDVVIADDSTDNTERIIKDYAATLDKPCITYFHNRKRAGIARSRNRAIEHARGDFIVFNDSDDLLLPGSLDRVQRYLSSNPDVSIYFGAITTKSGRKTSVGDPNLIGRKISYLEYLRSVTPGEFLPIFRRQWFDQPSMRFAGDIVGFEGMLWTRILKAGAIAYFSDVPIRLYDDLGADRLSRVKMSEAANRSRGFWLLLSEFGPDLLKHAPAVYAKRFVKLVIYFKMSGGQDTEVAEFIEKNLQHGGLRAQALYRGPSALSSLAFLGYRYASRVLHP